MHYKQSGPVQSEFYTYFQSGLHGPKIIYYHNGCWLVLFNLSISGQIVLVDKLYINWMHTTNVCSHNYKYTSHHEPR